MPENKTQTPFLLTSSKKITFMWEFGSDGIDMILYSNVHVHVLLRTSLYNHVDKFSPKKWPTLYVRVPSTYVRLLTQFRRQHFLVPPSDFIQPNFTPPLLLDL